MPAAGRMVAGWWRIGADSYKSWMVKETDK